MPESQKFVKVNREKSLIGPDHPKADLLGRVLGAALCTTSSERKKSDEDENNKKQIIEK